MYGISTALTLIIQTLGSMYLLIVLLRFLLQLVRADFYNPISQFTVKATQPLLHPLRRIIPGFGGVDIAGLVLAILVQFLIFFIILLVNAGFEPMVFAIGGGSVGTLFVKLFIWSLIGVAAMILRIFFFAMVISVILSWVAPGSRSPGALLVYQLSEPVLAPFRRILPNLGGLDLSPIIAFLAIQIVQLLVIGNLAVSTGMADRFGTPGLFF